MRAKKVYENIDFERGKDPKEALDIGIMNTAKREMKDMGYTYSTPNSLLRWASEFNFPEYIDLAVSIGADNLRHPIEIAVVAGCPEAVEALLKHGAQPDWVSDYTYKWVLPSWRNKDKFQKMNKNIQDTYTRVLELLKTHPNFTP